VALTELGRAAELAPRNPRYQYVYAVALEANGRIEAAIAALEAGLRTSPHDSDLLWALADYQRKAGRATAALRSACRLRQRMPQDPQLTALLAELRAVTGAKGCPPAAGE